MAQERQPDRQPESRSERPPERAYAQDRDMYGITREDAVAQLNRFLHDTLQEPEAELADLHLEDGRWQSEVEGSQRGIAAVFLLEHNGVIAPGHMTEDYQYDTPSKW